MLDEVERLWGMGLQTIPTNDDKRPIRKWKTYQRTRIAQEQIHRWFGGKVRGVRGVAVITGAASRVLVLDCDSEQSEESWRARIGDEMARTVCVRSPSGNHHYWFKIDGDDGDSWASWARHDEDHDFDVKAEGSIALLPPSPGYEWVRAPWDTEMVPAPKVLAKQGSEMGGRKAEGSGPRSMLSKLLEEPPESEGSRNVWLTKVAGHYAKTFRHRDAYEQHVRMAADLLSDPLPDFEIDKMLESIWSAEQSKPAFDVDENNGWLVERDARLQCVVAEKVDGEWVERLDEWADFAIEVLGVVDDIDVDRIYRVKLTRARDGVEREVDLPARVLADTRRLNEWLAQHGVTIVEPSGVRPRGVRPGARLARYLEAQDAPRYQIVDAMGWSDRAGGFVTTRELITPDGAWPLAGWRPHPRVEVVDYRYGFAPEQETREVLREILTFHHEQVAAVFGSWWAAAMIKPQLLRWTALFPLMALEAPSESGKTTGMFSMLVRLSGNRSGQVVPTRASARDIMAAHRSGIAWIDDAEDLDEYMDLIRAATGEGTMVKKGEDNTTNVGAQLVAPVLISGEGLGLHHEKALRDRSLVLDVPSPTSRQSQHGDGLQWDDIVRFQHAHPDLSEYAGTLVQLALSQSDVASQLPKLRGSVGRRFGDKIAILRAGSRVLSSLTGQPKWSDIVDEWVNNEVVHESWDNSLTLSMLPRALSVLGWPSYPVESAREDQPHTPVFVGEKDGPYEGMWVSPLALDEWWRRQQRGKVKERTETVDAIKQQLSAMEVTESKRIKIRDHNGMLPRDRTPMATFYRIPREAAIRVQQRARGVALGGATGGADGGATGTLFNGGE